MLGGSGYKVIILKDATAGFSSELADVATELVWPLFAEVLRVDEWVEAFFKGKGEGV
jgi:nicotinamidase-related amidase